MTNYGFNPAASGQRVSFSCRLVTGLTVLVAALRAVFYMYAGFHAHKKNNA
jgi:hypothetical protein